MTERRLPIGAEWCPSLGVHFRVWAPTVSHVELLLQSGTTGQPSQQVTLERESSGHHSLLVGEARPGDLYRYRLDHGSGAFPDPASRFQPEGVHGPSAVIAPGQFKWTDASWRGVRLPGQVIYELHVGTFTPEGTWQAAEAKLSSLAEIGISLIEVMPVGEFVGEFGWGYDGVDLFSPTRLYGVPDDFRRFVDRAHGLGLGVILDVVYNHLGPSGNYLSAFSPHYFTDRYHTDWGAAINFDGPHSAGVREFFTANAGYWIDEFHLDGLRIDAIQAIYDASPTHILAEIRAEVNRCGHGRPTLVIGENELQQARVIRQPGDGGYGLDAAWNDDFHHSIRVALTGHNEYYYGDYQGTPQEILSAVRWGYLYQGQWNARQGRRRGTPALGLPAERFVTFLQNHDQVANSGQGLRIHALTSPGRYRAATALLLLAPGTPMLFQGQEFASSAPFLFFADQEVDVAGLVRHGRQEFLRQFPSLAGPEAILALSDPCAPETFTRCKLDWSERESHRRIVTLHSDLIRLRREDPVFSAQDAHRVFGAVLAAEAFLLRYVTPEGNDRLLLVNLGRDLIWHPATDPLVASPEGQEWILLWSSEDPRYGGSGTGPIDNRLWRIPGHAAIALRSAPSGNEPSEILPQPPLDR